MVTVNKAGCILIDCKNKKVGLVYRKKQNDYTFPKGHQEQDESILETAIREVEEETQNFPEILLQLPFSSYIDSNNNECTTSWFLARTLGKSHKQVDPELQHEVTWVNPDEVEDKLSYDNLKQLWNLVKEKVQEYLEQLN